MTIVPKADGLKLDGWRMNIDYLSTLIQVNQSLSFAQRQSYHVYFKAYLIVYLFYEESPAVLSERCDRLRW